MIGVANDCCHLQLVKQRWASTTKPEALEKPILEALKAGDAKSEL
jgi:hypothetical protein